MKFKLNKKISKYFSTNFLAYVFGRFRIIKLVSKFIVSLFCQNKVQFSNKSHIVLTTDKDEIIQNIKRDGYFSGIKLKDKTLNKILTLCEESKLVTNRRHKTKNEYLTFNNFDEVNEFNKNNSEPICMINPTDNNLKKLCDEISCDKNLLNIANSFLGNVKGVKTILTWATVCDATDKWREEYGQTVTYHYDVFGLHYIYAFFYITDCNIDTGAHQLIKGSHRNKKIFKHLIGSAKKSELDLKKDYDLNDFINIEGPAGYGFIEDTSCFHKALAPKIKPRLALQFRYTI